MGVLHNSREPVLLFAGLLYAQGFPFEAAREEMSRRWGPVLFASESFPFTHTDYYEREMGAGLTRVYLAFENLIFPEDLVRFKRESHRMEESFAREGARQVNIDPGYVHWAKVVLASTKDYSHRIYMRQGVYAEVTLRYEAGGYRPLEHTYPDYREAPSLRFFHQARELYAERSRAGAGSR